MLRLLSVACLMAGCEEAAPLHYESRAEAEAEDRFARGWLPDFIPPSSRQISMRNDLDRNASSGEFWFDPIDHDAFVRRLARDPSRDRKAAAAFVYEDWVFWVADDKRHCTFRLQSQ